MYNLTDKNDLIKLRDEYLDFIMKNIDPTVNMSLTEVLAKIGFLNAKHTNTFKRNARKKRTTNTLTCTSNTKYACGDFTASISVQYYEENYINNNINNHKTVHIVLNVKPNFMHALRDTPYYVYCSNYTHVTDSNNVPIEFAMSNGGKNKIIVYDTRHSMLENFKKLYNALERNKHILC